MKHTAKTIKNIFTAFSAMALFVLASCNVGLGEALDLKGPTVIITKPAARENVMGDFNIEGIVTDDFAVGKIVVTLGDEEWVGENGKWKHKASGSATYDDDNDSTWVASNGERRVEWVLKGARIDSGTKTIDVSAVDKTGNKSAESHKSRDVIVDDDGPKVSIASPNLRTDSVIYTGVSSHKDITKVNMFITGDFTISGKTIDDNAIKYVDLIIKEKGMQKYKTRIFSEAANQPSSGNCKKVDSMRSWDVPITLEKIGVSNNEKHVFSIETVSEDDAGNTRTQNDLGHFCVWKTADTPWVSINLGQVASSAVNAFAGSTILGNAYDDAAIKEVKVTVRQGSSNGEVVTVTDKNGSSIKYENHTVYSASSEDENNVFFDIIVPEDCSTYWVSVQATDKGGKTSEVSADKSSGFIVVKDKTFPTVEVKHYVKSGSNNVYKNVTDSLFGDTSGKFFFEVKAFDNSAIKSVKMAYIDSSKKLVDYANAASSVWDSATSLGSATATGKTIKDGAVIRKEFSIPDKEISLFNAFDGNPAGLNIGLAAGKQRLTNQTFVFRVEDNENNAMTTTYTIMGDINAPKIEFDKKGSAVKIAVAVDGTNYEDYEVGKMIPLLTNQSKVKVTGKISDDSATAWGKCDKLKEGFTLELNGAELTPTVNETTGAFEAVSSADLSAAVTLLFTAELKDYAGNTANEKISYIIDVNKAKIEEISADTNDGCYSYKTSTKTINIFFRLNKAVTVNNNSPKITLNNGKVVNMSGLSTDKTKLLFNYTIAQGDSNVDKLNITSIDWGSIKLTDANGSDITNDIKASFESKKNSENLANNKDIAIINTLPALQSAVLTESTGYLVLTYDRAVAKGSGELKITQQKLSGGDGVDRVPPVLTTTEFASLGSGFDKYYEETTNGVKLASNGMPETNWPLDTATKYVLKADYNSNSQEIKTLYEEKAGAAYIIKQGIKSNKASLSNEGKTVTIKLGAYPLPCKGVKYRIEIPAGFVVDKKGGEDFPVAATDNKNWMTSAGIETPVIRIITTGTTVTYANSTFTANQPKTATFTVDCETPLDTAKGDTLTYSYDVKTYAAKTVASSEQYSSNLQVGGNTGNTGTAGTSENGNYSGTAVPIGSGTSDEAGLVYQITATAKKKDGPEAKGYAKASRTVIWVKNMRKIVEEHRADNDDRNNDDIKYTQTDQNWTTGYSAAHTTDWNGSGNRKKGLFIRGSDNVDGANSVSGLPLSWDTAKIKETAMMTKSGEDYYYMSWDINIEGDFYFMFLAGILDKKTITANGGEGPQCFCYAQNNLISTYAQYPVKAGNCISVNCKTTDNRGTNISFCVGEAGKPKKMRDYVAP